ncbi:hypothetical protein PG993_006211 [Apiospora rasikravindrae]|uniref:Uncharacterized protein n=1 Tax=Apiospora rasikravindrae TaxID=990691 RepID=A0ABR1T7J1_9PEZI
MSEWPLPWNYYWYMAMAIPLVGWLQLTAEPFIPACRDAPPRTPARTAVYWVTSVWLWLAPILTALLLVHGFHAPVPAWVLATSLVELYFSKQILMLPRSEEETKEQWGERQEKQELQPLVKGQRGPSGYFAWDGSHVC